MDIEIYNITKYFGKSKILNNISLKINSGEIVALLGPSGSGKTTLLRIIAGLDQHNGGSIIFNGRDISDISIRDRRIGFVFQNYALFRHMTVVDNISFGIKVLPRSLRPTSFVIKNKIDKLLKMMKLTRFANRYPSQLSGGQKQRVALARALAIEPKVLLLDEPFGALDTQVRKDLRRWLRNLHRELEFTGIFVTHDQEEAMEISSRIVIMNHGNVEQIGTPQDVWYGPISKFVLEFLGDVNKLTGELRNSQLFLGNYCMPVPYISNYQGLVEVFFRPWEMIMNEYSNSRYFLPVQIIDISLRGYYYQLSVQPVDHWHDGLLNIVVSSIDGNKIPKIGDFRYLGVENARLYVGELLL